MGTPVQPDGTNHQRTLASRPGLPKRPRPRRPGPWRDHRPESVSGPAPDPGDPPGGSGQGHPAPV